MAFNNKSLKNLTPYKAGWLNQPTKSVKIPVALLPEVLKIAHQIDSGQSLVAPELNAVLRKIESGVKGYKVNNASSLIKELKKMGVISGGNV